MWEIAVLGKDGEIVNIVLRERPHEAPQLPLFREVLGPDIRAAIEAFDAALPDGEFKAVYRTAIKRLPGPLPLEHCPIEAVACDRWWAVAGSNCGPPACKAGALTG